MEHEFTYWFVRVKEVNSEFTHGEQVEDHQFRVMGDREEAKKYCIDKYGNLPFKKPKNAVKGEKYFYLMSSNKYWYDRHYKEFNCVCENCGKSFVRVGDTHKSKILNYRDKDICSIECHVEYKEKLYKQYNSIENEEYWIDESSHPLTNKDKKLIGYIYRITNKKTMMSYIGKTTKPPLFRWWQHLKVDGKFEQENLTELLFEVIEIVYWKDDPMDEIRFNNGNEKLSFRERYFIELYDLVDEGYNKI